MSTPKVAPVLLPFDELMGRVAVMILEAELPDSEVSGYKNSATITVDCALPEHHSWST